MPKSGFPSSPISESFIPDAVSLRLGGALKQLSTALVEASTALVKNRYCLE
jgi:hypothetical protein